MYRPEAFEVDDGAALLARLVAATAATLVHHGADGLTSTVLPMLFDPTAGSNGDAGSHGTLVGHVARGNPVVEDARVVGGRLEDVLVVVTGAAGYISPSWYPSKAVHGRVVPTWDYLVVEVAGPLLLHEDPAWLLDVVTRLTDRHEAGRAAPWAVTDAPEGYVAANLPRIVGIEVPIRRLVAKAKLSQNRPAADRAGVVAGLRADGGPEDAALADEVAAAEPGA